MPPKAQLITSVVVIAQVDIHPQLSSFPGCERERVRDIGFPSGSWACREQSSFLTIQTMIIYWSHIRIPIEICQDEGVQVSEMYSNTSIPFGFQHRSLERGPRLAILMGSIDWHWYKLCFFFFLSHSIWVKFRESVISQHKQPRSPLYLFFYLMWYCINRTVFRERSCCPLCAWTWVPVVLQHLCHISLDFRSPIHFDNRCRSNDHTDLILFKRFDASCKSYYTQAL